MLRAWLQSIGARGGERLDEARIRLARPTELLTLTLLGLVTGIVAGGIIVLFILLVETVQPLLLGMDQPEHFEALSGEWRLALPLLAAIVILGLFKGFGAGMRMLGIPHVLERMDRHQGRIAARAFGLQFAGAALALIGGHSVGREGPHVFLGAASGSLLGQRLALPHNAIRTLVGCGTAAGIAASFNTPLAGVVFALEVVMMEYSVTSFIPVILAAVSATTVSNAVFGDYPAFTLPSVQLGSLWELVPVLALGLAAGAVSALFIQSVQVVDNLTSSLSRSWRFLLAGVVMGAFGWLLPQTMGIGYDTVDQALHGGIATTLLLALLAGKLAATSCCIGMGIPGGTIGPALFIGAMLGALFAGFAEYVPLLPAGELGLFALLGMGAMMSGSLQAPLAALTAMLELTDNPDIILPGMLVVVVSGITAKVVFGKESQFITMLRSGGLDVADDPLSRALRRVGVASVMDRRFAQVGRQLSRERAIQLSGANLRFLLVSLEGETQVLMPSTHLAGWLSEQEAGDPDDVIDLLEIPAPRWNVAQIGLQANLLEASAALEPDGTEALAVKRRTRGGTVRVYGVLTSEMVEGAYRRPIY